MQYVVWRLSGWTYPEVLEVQAKQGGIKNCCVTELEFWAAGHSHGGEWRVVESRVFEDVIGAPATGPGGRALDAATASRL